MPGALLAVLLPFFSFALRAEEPAAVSLGDRALKDPWGAILESTRRIDRGEGDARAYSLRATAYGLLGEWEKSLRDADKALSLSAGDPLASDARAAAEAELGRVRDALNDSSRALASRPEDAWAYAARARAYERMGLYSSTLADYQRAAALDPRFEPAYQDAAALYALPKDPRPAALAPSSPTPQPKAPVGSPWTVWTLAGGFLLSLGLLLGTLDFWRRPAQAPAAPVIGGRFELLDPIGHGGMGIVYAAIDVALGRDVAVKRMRDEVRLDPKERSRFLEEARLTASLRHPSIVDIHAVVEEGTELFMVFELLQGRTLEQVLAAESRLPPERILAILGSVCDALRYAHSRDVVHRDLKPSNIMCGLDGRIKVMDFGIARRAKDAAGRAGITSTVMGTPFYMAPEASIGIIRKESDVFSLGACLYEMWTGQHPYPSPVTATVKLGKSFRPASRIRPCASTELDALIDSALEPDPDLRLSSVADFAERLERALRV